jgi:lambda family phage portal protein
MRAPLTLVDRLGLLFAPQRTLRSIARRNYDAAKVGRRTDGWGRSRADVNATVRRAGADLRMHARDLQRNNAWARRAVEVIVNNVVGWGSQPRPTHSSSPLNEKASELWARWADSDCDADQTLNFAGVTQAVMRAAVVDGEVLIRRRWRRLSDGYAVPLQLQQLEIDHLDTSKEGRGKAGPIIQGVEFDAVGQRAAYWLFDNHPGSNLPSSASRRISARDVLHIGRPERPGQVRFVTWFASVITTLKDLDSFEDGELQRQAVAASFAAFITDPQGSADPLLGASNEIKYANGDVAENIEPGAILNLPIGKEVTFPNPPSSVPGEFAVRNLRRVAAGLGLSYEDLVGDYSNVNFSSARMGRIVHAGNVRSWQNAMLEPLFLRPVWDWFLEAALWGGLLGEPVSAAWTHPPLQMIDPDKEVAAAIKSIRAGITSPDDMVRELGGNPDQHWPAYAEAFKRLDALGVVIDGDARKISGAGQAQPAAPTPAPEDDPKPAAGGA